MYKKRNVAYVKPQEPSFLTKLKREAGYVPGPDINTKRQQLPVDYDSDHENPDESPAVVVLKAGDLTAEEAAKITAEKELEKANAKADLSERVIFQKPTTSKRENEESSEKKKSQKKQKKEVKKSLLSFDEDEC